MFSYYFWLGWRNLKRNPALTILMVITLAIGVAASVSTLTILHVMSGDPIPRKSDKLFSVILDNNPAQGYTPGELSTDHQMTYRDLKNLLASQQGERRMGLYAIDGIIEPARSDLAVTNANGLAASRDIFRMLDIPFLYGQAWRESEDAQGRDVVVLSKKTAEKLFAAVNPVGQYLKMWGREYQIVGVFDTWSIKPRFYHYNGRTSAFATDEEFIVPLSSAIRHETPHSGSMSCSAKRDPGWQALLDSECTWLSFWFEMKNPAERQSLQSYIDHYVSEQAKLGRFPRHAPNRLFNVREWLLEMHVVGNDNKLSAWLAGGFLLLCLVNTIGLLLAKFSVRSAEVGVRRALGASRKEIFTQFLIETSVIGLVGAVLGIVLSFGALMLIAMQSRYLKEVAHMDWVMLLTAVLMSIGAAILAGMLPTWRACQITPAIQLKSQ